MLNGNLACAGDGSLAYARWKSSLC
jgi:hypothetical protein